MAGNKITTVLGFSAYSRLHTKFFICIISLKPENQPQKVANCIPTLKRKINLKKVSNTPKLRVGFKSRPETQSLPLGHSTTGPEAARRTELGVGCPPGTLGHVSEVWANTRQQCLVQDHKENATLSAQLQVEG